MLVTFSNGDDLKYLVKTQEQCVKFFSSSVSTTPLGTTWVEILNLRRV